VKLSAFLASLLIGSTAMAQTAPAAPEPAPATPAQAAPAPAAPAPAVEAPKPAAPAFKFQLKGFVSMTSGLEDGAYSLYPGQGAISATAFAPGQKSSATAPSIDTVVNPTQDKNALVFDVRQSRFNFSVSGPQVMGGATPTAVLEIDFFGGFSAGNFGDASLFPRMRLAYSELNWGNHKLQFGQQNDIIFALAPTSLSHIAFPLAFFTGNLGWRRPGIFGFHTFPMSPDAKVEVAWEVGKSTWADAAASVGGNIPDPAFGTTQIAGQVGGHNKAEASGLPAVEGRVTFLYSNILSAFVAGHYNQVDLTGQGDLAPPVGTATNISVVSYHVGAKLTYMGATLQGSYFTGKNTAPLLGNFAEFKLGPKGEDVNASGYWAQAGYNLTKELSVWAFYGNQKPKEDEARAAKLTKLENTTTNVQLIYRDGGYAIGAEWTNFQTKMNGQQFFIANAAAPATTPDQTAKANQYLLTANYFF
jgi:hypothetical protein